MAKAGPAAKLPQATPADGHYSAAGLRVSRNSAARLVLASPCIGFTVAVRTQETEVREPVVVTVAVDVVKLEGDRWTLPVGQAARLTLQLLQACCHEPSLTWAATSYATASRVSVRGRVRTSQRTIAPRLAAPYQAPFEIPKRTWHSVAVCPDS
jgi:hypothetical protein